MAALRRLRYRIGRWLLLPEAARIYKHYRSAAVTQAGAHKHRESERCEYIAVGARYVGQGWPHTDDE